MADEKETEILIVDGEPVEVFTDKDGNIRRADNSRFVRPSPKFLIQSSERGRELIQRRHTLAQERAIAGLAKGFGLDLTQASGAEAWEEAVRLLAVQFAKSENVRGMSEALVTIGRATGYLRPETEVQNPDDGELVKALISFLKAKVRDRSSHEDG